MKRLSRLTTAELMVRFDAGEPMATIAQAAGITRVAVWRRLKQAGADPRKMHGRVTWVVHTCSVCGTVFAKKKGDKRSPFRRYCSRRCYYRFRHSDCTVMWRQGTRIARDVVAGYYGTLPPESVVHHIDKDDRNNDASNLMLFANQRDHLRWHHAVPDPPTPLWDGSQIKTEAA